MKINWRARVINIEKDAALLLRHIGINRGLRKIDYATIFPKSDNDYKKLLEDLQLDGLPVKMTPRGTVFQLTTPVITRGGMIFLIRIRVYQPDIQQNGYVDYHVTDYKKFKERYLLTNTVDITNNSDGVEMLTAKNTKVIIYFPDLCMGETLKSNIRHF